MVKNKRLTLGLLSTNTNHSNLISKGIESKCKNKDINLITFIGGFYKSFINIYNIENHIFQMINIDQIDALLINTSNIFHAVEKSNAVYNFYKKIDGIPIINISNIIDNYPSVVIDNKGAIHDLMDHLIQVHKKKNIVFVSGYLNTTDSKERLEAYNESLQKYNIIYDKPHVIYADFGSIEISINLLSKLFELKEQGKFDFDSLVCANDHIASAAYRVANIFGLKIPEDIAVTGFDNNLIAKDLYPSLTTVNQPNFLLGERAVEIILDKINGKEIKDLTKIKLDISYGKSCGCNISNLNSSDDEIMTDIKDKSFEYIYNNKQILINNLFSKLNNKKRFYNSVDVSMLDELGKNFINEFLDDLKNGTNKILFFICKLSKTDVLYYDYINFLHLLTNTFHSIIIAVVNEKNILKNINLLIGEIIDQLININEVQFNRVAVDDLTYWGFYNFHHITKSFSIEELSENLKLSIPGINPSVCLIAYYKYVVDKAFIPEYSKTIYNYNINDKLTDLTNHEFKTKDLFPDKLINDNERYSLVINPIYNNQDYFGYICVDFSFFMRKNFNYFDFLINSTVKSMHFLNDIEKAKEELETTNKKLKDLDKLKNDFIANITHDFRSPLMVVLNLSELSLNLDYSKEELYDNFKTIYQAGIKLKFSIDRLLEIAKMDAKGVKIHVTNVDIKKYLENLYYYYLPVTKNMNIDFLFEESIDEVADFYTDIEKLEQIINNLMSNAIKFVDKKYGKIVLSLKENDTFIDISILDNGIGIKKENLDSIFNRFEQTQIGLEKSRYKGTGIGLSFAKQLVNYIHGQISVESQGLGHGANFTIKLPKGKSHFKESDFHTFHLKYDNRKEMKEIIELENIKTEDGIFIKNNFIENSEKEIENPLYSVILVVDDDQIIRKIIYHYLINAGYTNIVMATNGKFGLEAVYKYTPDLIISDINMPDMNGEEFYQNIIINESFKKTPFIFLSAITENNSLKNDAIENTVTFLKKPIEEKDFILKVKTNLNQSFLEKKDEKLETAGKIYNYPDFYNKFSQLVEKRNSFSLISIEIRLCDDGEKTDIELMNIIQRSSEIMNLHIRGADLITKKNNNNFLLLLKGTNKRGALLVINKIISGINSLIKEDKKINIYVGYVESESVNELILKDFNLNDKDELTDLIEENSNKRNKYIDLLLSYSQIALERALKTKCADCSYESKEDYIFIDNKCPVCDSLKLMKKGKIPINYIDIHDLD